MRTVITSMVFSVVVLAANGISFAADESRSLLHPLFCDHMVLQRDAPARIWGWADAAATVTIQLGDESAVTATADEEGRWQAELPAKAAGGPWTMKVVCGDMSIEVSDVMFGDVWICSGQSNMQWSVAQSASAEEEIAAANHPGIRLFSVPRKIAPSPKSTVEGRWSICSPESIPGFSAVGYYFGRSLKEKIDVPIGLVHCSWGGTVAEAWVSAGSLENLEDFRDAVAAAPDQIQKQFDPEESPKRAVEKFWEQVGSPRSAGNWREAKYDVTSWGEIQVPGRFEDTEASLSEFDGIVRFRREFTLTEAQAQADATLFLGKIDDVDTTWINGRKVGSTQRWDRGRKYRVKAKHLRAGVNSVAVRVLDVGLGGGFYSEPKALRLESASGTVPLAGSWRFEKGKSNSELPEYPIQPRWPNPNISTALYNAMIAPLQPLAVRGAIWYQGESNAGRPWQYRPLLKTLIQDWRDGFQNQGMPFFIVQLANFKEQQAEPSEGGWAEIRESQQRVADESSNVGIAIITDIGEADDIHPRNKQDVGHRLALQALKIAYDQADVVASGPEYASCTSEGGKLRVRFKPNPSPLNVRGEQLKGFAIAGESGEFVWADATVDGDSIVLSADSVERPSRVRYNWANNPIGNLFNDAGLPAAPFRSDVE